jgi:hypothetical protein
MSERNFWIGVASRSHVELGVRGGFAQLNHGKKAPLRRLEAGDGLVYYSPRTDYPDGGTLKSFTAIGIVRTGVSYEAEMSDSFHPFRLDVEYLEAHEAPISPLIERLSFIRRKESWGAAFRFGHLKVPERDFRLIAEAMGVDSNALAGR